jgi:hypothetical protein
MISTAVVAIMLAIDPAMRTPSLAGHNTRGRIPTSIAADSSVVRGANIASPDPDRARGQSQRHNRRLHPITMAIPTSIFAEVEAHR